jgi:hypothetical protein
MALEVGVTKKEAGESGDASCFDGDFECEWVLITDDYSLPCECECS